MVQTRQLTVLVCARVQFDVVPGGDPAWCLGQLSFNARGLFVVAEAGSENGLSLRRDLVESKSRGVGRWCTTTPSSGWSTGRTRGALCGEVSYYPGGWVTMGAVLAAYQNELTGAADDRPIPIKLN